MPFDIQRCEGCAHPLLYCICYLFEEEETMLPDYENLRTMDEFREAIDAQVKDLRRAGFTAREEKIWLAGARWATSVFCAMQKEQGISTLSYHPTYAPNNPDNNPEI